MTINLFFLSLLLFLFIFLHFSLFIHGNFMSSLLACFNFKFQTIVSYIYCNRFPTYCNDYPYFHLIPRRRTAWLSEISGKPTRSSFFLCCFFIIVYFSNFTNSKILIVVTSYRRFKILYPISDLQGTASICVYVWEGL